MNSASDPEQEPTYYAITEEEIEGLCVTSIDTGAFRVGTPQYEAACEKRMGIKKKILSRSLADKLSIGIQSIIDDTTKRCHDSLVEAIQELEDDLENSRKSPHEEVGGLDYIDYCDVIEALGNFKKELKKQESHP